MLFRDTNGLDRSIDSLNHLRRAKLADEIIVNNSYSLFMLQKLQRLSTESQEQQDSRRLQEDTGSSTGKQILKQELVYTIVFVLIFVFSFILCVLILCYQPCRTCLLYCCALFVELLLLICPRRPANDEDEVVQPPDGRDIELRRAPLPAEVAPKQLTVAMAEAWIDIEIDDFSCKPSDFDDIPDCISQVVVQRNYEDVI